MSPRYELQEFTQMIWNLGCIVFIIHCNCISILLGYIHMRRLFMGVGNLLRLKTFFISQGLRPPSWLCLTLRFNLWQGWFCCLSMHNLLKIPKIHISVLLTVPSPFDWSMVQITTSFLFLLVIGYFRRCDTGPCCDQTIKVHVVCLMSVCAEWESNSGCPRARFIKCHGFYMK